MKLRLAPQIAECLRRELRRAGKREIGGILMGEHVQDDVFRILDLSVQRMGGSHAGFLRQPDEHLAQLERFFERTGQDFSRFNYLGEWHSHPSFEPLPSAKDIGTMQSIVEDPAVGANFLVLIVTKLGSWRRLEMSATVFTRDRPPYPASIGVEQKDWGPIETIARRLLRRAIGT